MSTPTPPPAIQLTAIDASPILPVDPALAPALRPATVLVHEWTDYWAACPGATALTINGRPAPPLPGGAFRVRFENRLGRAVLQAHADTGPVGPPLHVEVISRKFATAADYVSFTDTLLSDLFERSLRLPFDLGAPTARTVTEARQPPTPLFVMHFLSACGTPLEAALRMILRAPHHDVERQETWLDAARVFEADADTLLDIATAPHRWERAPRPDLPVARRLGGHVPRDIRQPVTEVTHDTPENRFTRAFLETLVRAADVLPGCPWWPRVPEQRQRAIAGVGRACRRALAHPVLAGAGRLARFPAASRVLTRREGYRELHDLWRRFHTARRPVFAALAEAIDLRDSALLYEVWAFYALAEAVGEALGEAPVLTARITDAHGLACRAQARFGPHGTLTYNQTTPTYSTPLRPDFLWEGAGGARVAFDAKFRLGNFGAITTTPPAGAPASRARDAAVDPAADPWPDHAAAIPDAAGDAPDAWLDRVVDDDGQRYPAIGGMHHYRDAMGLAAALAVYPGRRDAFYAHGTGRRDVRTLADILEGRFQGVGALGMTPRPAAPAARHAPADAAAASGPAAR